MQLNKYQSGAIATAIYPGKLMYPTLGLCGEIGEVAAVLFDDIGRSTEALKEIGDVLWYAANVAADADLTLSMCCDCERFKEVETKCETVEWIMPILVAKMGVVAENVKKAVRDNDSVLTTQRQENIRVALGWIVGLLSQLALERGGTLDECAKMNLAKLKSRQERGKLGGDGDNR